MLCISSVDIDPDSRVYIYIYKTGKSTKIPAYLTNSMKVLKSRVMLIIQETLLTGKLI